MQPATIGRIVHYRSYGTPQGEFQSEPRAAIITGVYDDNENHVDLCVLNPTGIFFNQRTPFSIAPKPGHWSWPPKVAHHS